MSAYNLTYCSLDRVISYLLAVPDADMQGNGVYAEIPGGRAKVPVADGPWVFAVDPQEFVTIGIAATPNGEGEGTVGAQQPRNIGGPQRMFESYRVPVVIRVTDGDPKAQRKVRLRALELMSVYEYAIRVDPTLGGAITAGAWIGGLDFDQTPPDDDESDGCAIWLSFFVAVSTLLT